MTGSGSRGGFEPSWVGEGASFEDEDFVGTEVAGKKVLLGFADVVGVGSVLARLVGSRAFVGEELGCLDFAFGAEEVAGEDTFVVVGDDDSVSVVVKMAGVVTAGGLVVDLFALHVKAPDFAIGFLANGIEDFASS